ncbi:MAG: RNA-binding protein [Salinarimonadaceae bacterium]|nr:MAG: RNA-binding protein [Salinarimonadaceae bacterium]
MRRKARLRKARLLKARSRSTARRQATGRFDGPLRFGRGLFAATPSGRAARRGRGVPRKEPLRTCIVTREVRPAHELIRFAVSPEGEVVPDLRGTLPGRGAWVAARRDAVEIAVRKRAFARAFKAPVKTPDGLADAIDAAMLVDLRQALAMANKAGAVVTGFHKVEGAAQGETIAALVHAAEAAPDGRRKIGQALRRRHGEADESIPVIDFLSGDDLDLALGRSHVIHAALVAGAGSRGFLERWRRLCVFRGSIAMNDAPHEEERDDDENEPAGL